METLAAVAFGLQQPLWAARLLGCADALREAIGTPRPPADQPEHDRTVASAGACLGAHAFAVAWADGKTMAPDDAVAHTLQAVAQGTHV